MRSLLAWAAAAAVLLCSGCSSMGSMMRSNSACSQELYTAYAAMDAADTPQARLGCSG